MTTNEPQSPQQALGHQRVGSGPNRVVILNDWLCDTSTWDTAREFLDTGSFSFAFTDLRGYGRSRGRAGEFTLVEAAADVLALADALGWQQFALVGHSMSALIALHLAQHAAQRVQRLVLLTPPPPSGFGKDEAMIAASQRLALADDATRLAVFEKRFGSRLSPGWTKFKARRWRDTADPEAAAAYVALFTRDGLPSPGAIVEIPVLAITGEQDIPPMRAAAVTLALQSFCTQLEVVPLMDSGHYPMQELPALTVALVERFLSEAPTSSSDTAVTT
ncbi:MAG TPA: alpha/beta hydrolase [Polyangiaceae bacterium]|nr:alpha/beta hydrolase [Polyangiaceae bacterium]